ncbi:uncharacterized protein [Ptychodera flava]|uniref:uncharacterized protein n=1 Tax=Ptychodera flava TaxID=63121 RepID=UPI00396A6599
MTKKMYVRTLKVVVLIVATSLLISSLLSEEANTTPSISDEITAEQVLSLSKQQQELSSPGDMSPSLVDDETQPPREMQIQTPDTGQEEGADFSERMTTSSEETRVDLSYFGVQTTTPSKETYHTNNPTLSRDDQSTLQNYEMNAISDKTQVTAETQDLDQLRDMKYLLAINFYQGGPNFHYDNFKIGLFYAITRNRAIVTLLLQTIMVIGTSHFSGRLMTPSREANWHRRYQSLHQNSSTHFAMDLLKLC